MLRIYILLFSFLMISPAFAQVPVKTSASAAGLSGQDLLTMCGGLYDVDYGYCAGYMKAIADVMGQQAVHGQTACNQGNVRPQQLLEAMKMQAADDPALAAQPASVLATQSIARSYPCR